MLTQLNIVTMNLNFVFDKISPNGMPVGNIICFLNNVTPE